MLSCVADMGMSGTALQLPQGVVLAMPGSVQRHRMDLNALKEQLQKLVPGAHLTLAHHPTEVALAPSPSFLPVPQYFHTSHTSLTPMQTVTSYTVFQGTVSSGSPSLEGLPPVYPQAPLSAAQTAMGSIPLTVVGPGNLPHQEGLVATSEAGGMLLPQTVRLPGGETVAFMGPVMMEPRCQAPLNYPAMLPVGVEKDGRAAPLQPGPPLSRTPSLKESEEQGEGRQTRIARFQVTKVAEEAVRRGK